MKTNLQVLNEISAKLEGEDNATSITEALNNIANALGDNNPDEIVSVSNSLEDILSVAGQGGGGGVDNPLITLNVINNGNDSLVGKGVGFLCIANNSIAFDEDTVIEGNSTGILNLFGYLYGDDYLYDIGEYLNVSDFMSSFGDEVNCTIGEYEIIVTDPSKPASCTLTLADGI